ncbi:hypothetical protein VNO80_19349 [Phaseolus coccineus]|uniref:Uncharacterized protein n=1 Tax=Phaseolus coccineus TaxID=3886 RepID=A0AAN9MFY8_PHACN
MKVDTNPHLWSLVIVPEPSALEANSHCFVVVFSWSWTSTLIHCLQFMVVLAIRGCALWLAVKAMGARFAQWRGVVGLTYIEIGYLKPEVVRSCMFQFALDEKPFSHTSPKDKKRKSKAMTTRTFINLNRPKTIFEECIA